MKFFQALKRADFELAKFNIHEPRTTIELTSTKDCLMIVPALSLDSLGTRLGRGGGFYDRYLARNSNIFKIAIVPQACFATEPIPSEQHDIKVNLIIVLAENSYRLIPIASDL